MTGNQGFSSPLELNTHSYVLNVIFSAAKVMVTFSFTYLLFLVALLEVMDKPFNLSHRKEERKKDGAA